ncbi:MAG: ThuA domain-containing protein [Planctomycetaceae bacterium]|nr:ThuA domain-containing protein [Planctomycetaceae bacterium]
MRSLAAALVALLVALAFASPIIADEGKATRLLLLAQGPDGHPKGTHEYFAGQTILDKCLSKVPNLQRTIIKADGDWPEGPELLAKADGVVLFVSEGAKWIGTNPARRAAFADLAKRGGGLAVLHWGMGTKPAEHIEPFVALFGACHGGPDRKFKFLETQVRVAAADHPATKGLSDFTIKEEFYYQLKRLPEARLVPLLTADIDGERPMVAWAWERPDGGRSLGFSGCHYHENWSRSEYRRFISQAVLWTLKITPPEKDFPAEVSPEDLRLE